VHDREEAAWRVVWWLAIALFLIAWIGVVIVRLIV
jgi:hypothetical protein